MKLGAWPKTELGHEAAVAQTPNCQFPLLCQALDALEDASLLAGVGENNSVTLWALP